jgi:hypothetical protein
MVRATAPSMAPTAPHGDDQPLLRQLLHHLVEAAPFLAAEDVLGRDRDIVEEQLGRVGGVQPDLLEVAPAGEALGAVGFDARPERRPWRLRWGRSWRRR